MKIKEVLALTMTEPLDVIAKNYLTIGKNAAREALKEAGCFSKNGVKGWFFDGDQNVLEQSIYEFVKRKQSQSPRDPENKKVIKTIKESGKQEIQIDGRENNLKKATYEVEGWIHDELKILAIRQKRNVSEIVNEILKKAVEKQNMAERSKVNV